MALKILIIHARPLMHEGNKETQYWRCLPCSQVSSAGRTRAQQAEDFIQRFGRNDRQGCLDSYTDCVQSTVNSKG